MSYKRKTRDVFVVQSCYEGVWSDETYEDSGQDAKAQLACYRANLTVPVRLIKRREKIEEAEFS